MSRVSKPAIWQGSKDPAGLEVGDTAGLETCATGLGALRPDPDAGLQASRIGKEPLRAIFGGCMNKGVQRETNPPFETGSRELGAEPMR